MDLGTKSARFMGIYSALLCPPVSPPIKLAAASAGCISPKKLRVPSLPEVGNMPALTDGNSEGVYNGVGGGTIRPKATDVWTHLHAGAGSRYKSIVSALCE
jgi:hypothetical protein